MGVWSGPKLLVRGTWLTQDPPEPSRAWNRPSLLFWVTFVPLENPLIACLLPFLASVLVCRSVDLFFVSFCFLGFICLRESKRAWASEGAGQDGEGQRETGP